MKKIFLSTSIIVALLLVGTSPVHAEQNAGFVNGIWLSKQHATEGETIQIFAAVQNQTTVPMQGVVIFFDADVPIGTVAFNVPVGEFQPVAMQYALDAGSHSLSARITSEAEVDLAYTTLVAKKIFADADNDKDGIADSDDTDDDNDGASDEAELAAGTDPKVADIQTIEFPTISTGTITKVVKVAADTVADTSTNASNIFFNAINPRAKEIAEQLRKKSVQMRKIDATPQKKVASSDPATSLLRQGSEGQAITTVDTNKSPSRLRQMAAVGLTALAFGFEHWLWHLAVVGVLMIIRAIYRRRVI